MIDLSDKEAIGDNKTLRNMETGNWLASRQTGGQTGREGDRETDREGSEKGLYKKIQVNPKNLKDQPQNSLTDSSTIQPIQFICNIRPKKKGKRIKA